MVDRIVSAPIGHLYKRYDLVCIGVCAVDCIYYVDQLPALDAKCSARDLVIQGGGVGGNIVWAAAKMALRVALISKVGDDQFGAYVREELVHAGIETAGVIVQASARTPLSAIIVDSQTHSRTCIHNRSAMSPLVPAEVTLDLCENVRVMVSDGRYPEATWLCIAEARASGARVVIAVEHLNETTLSLCAIGDVVILPEKFLDVQLAPELGVRALARNTGAHNLIVTMGARGSLLLAGDSLHRIPAALSRIVDTVGAGDTFTAALCFAIIQGDDLDVCCRFASAVAGRSCTVAGSRLGIPPLAELRLLLETARQQE